MSWSLILIIAFGFGVAAMVRSASGTQKSELAVLAVLFVGLIAVGGLFFLGIRTTRSVHYGSVAPSPYIIHEPPMGEHINVRPFEQDFSAERASLQAELQELRNQLNVRQQMLTQQLQPAVEATVEKTEESFETLDSAWNYLTAPKIVLEQVRKQSGMNEQQIKATARTVELIARAVQKQIVLQSKTPVAEQLADAPQEAVAEPAAVAAEAAPATQPIEEAKLIKEISTPAEKGPYVTKQGVWVHRPDWVRIPVSKQHGPVYKEVIQVGPYATREECREAAEAEIQKTIKNYVQQMANESGYGTAPAAIPDLLQMGIGPHYIETNLIADEYWETTNASVGPMQNLYKLIQIEENDRKYLLHQWQQAARGKRLTLVGIFGSLLLGGVGLLFGLLKADTWTKGYYTKRLFIGVPATIIGGSWIASWFA